MKHQILRQRVDVEWSAPGDALAVRAHLEDWCRGVLASELERALDRWSGPEGRILVVERIAVNLSVTVQGEAGIGLELAQAVGEEVFLGLEALDRDGAGDAMRVWLPVQAAVMDEVLHYLATGCLPWTASGDSEWRARACKALQDIDDDGMTALQEVLQGQGARERLARDFLDEALGHVLPRLRGRTWRIGWMQHVRAWVETDPGASMDRRRMQACLPGLMSAIMATGHEDDRDAWTAWTAQLGMANVFPATSLPPFPGGRFPTVGDGKTRQPQRHLGNEGDAPALGTARLPDEVSPPADVAPDKRDVGDAQRGPGASPAIEPGYVVGQGDNQDDLVGLAEPRQEPDGAKGEKWGAPDVVWEPTQERGKPHGIARRRGGETDGIYIQDAGMVIVGLYLPRLLERLGLAEGDRVTDVPRSLALIHYLAFGGDACAEWECVLGKVLCGVPVETPMGPEHMLTPEQREEGDGLLEAVIANWGVLGNTSPAGLRATFLQRPGLLRRSGADWRLALSRNAFDVLMDRLPWPISITRLPWMPGFLYTDWS